jgi:hypothetical protein
MEIAARDIWSFRAKFLELTSSLLTSTASRHPRFQTSKSSNDWYAIGDGQVSSFQGFPR